MDIRKYDIVKVDLQGTIGSEQGGIRPVIVLQNNQGNRFSTTTIVAPLTSKIKNLSQSTHTLIQSSDETGLREDSMLLGEQMRVISNQRIICKIGTVTDKEEREAIKRVYLANFGE